MVTAQLERRAYELGAIFIVDSWVKHKKYAVFYNNKWIHFGDNRYEDYTAHRDDDRRQNYLSRSTNIRNKHGQKTYKIKTSPNYWAVNLLW